MTIKRWLSLFLIVTMLPISGGFAGFDTTGAGARGPGMADAQTAIADDVNALHYNPAGLPQIKDAQIGTQYGQILNGANDGSNNTSTYLGYAHPLQNLKSGVLGFSFDQFKANILFSERTITIGYGQKFKAPLFDLPGLWTGGFNIKQLHRQYQPDRYTENGLNSIGSASGQPDPLFAKNGYSKDAYALDLGTLYRFGPANQFSAGAALMNVNQPDMSLGGDGDKVPLMGKVALAWRTRNGIRTAEVRRTNRLAGRTDTDIALGGEHRFKLDSGCFIIRGGLAQGSRQYKELSGGVSYEFARTSLDYSFTMPLDTLSRTTNTSFRFGLSFKLTSEDEKATALAKKSKSTRQVPVDSPTVTVPTSQEAPPVLTAPHPVTKSTEENAAEMNKRDIELKTFGELLGNYYTRKDQGAPLSERKTHLEIIRHLFSDKDIDMTLVDREWADLQKEMGTAPTPAPSPTAIPVATPIPTPEPTPKPIEAKKIIAAPKVAVVPGKPVRAISPAKMETLGSVAKAVATSPALVDAMRFYRQAVERGLSDRERIEVLETVLLRFGEAGAKEVNVELERLRKRLKK